MNHLIYKIINEFQIKGGRYTLVFLLWLFTSNVVILNSQCLFEAMQPISFTATNDNPSLTHRTQYLLTDFRDNILSISDSTMFSGQPAGIYKIYGINFLIGSTIFISVGENIEDITGTCFDVSLPYEVTVCLSADASCNVVNGSYSFQSNGGNPALYSAFILTDQHKFIFNIVPTPSFTNIEEGDFFIFPINYATVSGLNIGNNIEDIAGECFDIGNPLPIRSCAACNYCEGNISFNATGMNQALTTNYALTDISGIILNTNVSPSFNNVEPGTYRIYGVNFNQTQTLNGFTIGSNISNLSGTCFDVSDPYSFIVCPRPEAMITGPNSNLCSGESAILTASGGTSYLWSNGANTAEISVSPLSTTTFTVTVTNDAGCSSTAEISVVVENCNTTCSYCAGNISFNATGMNPSLSTTYVLTNVNGNILMTNSQPTFANVTAGDYNVYGVNFDPSQSLIGLNVGSNITGLNGTCFDVSSPLNFEVCSAPIAMITGTSDICVGELTTLTASGGESYLWSNGFTTSTINVNPVVTTNYSVTVTNENGCTSITSFEVQVDNCDLPCDYCEGTISFNSVGMNTSLTTTYVLTSNNGVIISINSLPEFNNVPPGLFNIYGINYNPMQPLNGLEIDNNINSITGACFDISDPFSVRVCEKPIGALSTQDTICQGETFLLEAQGGGTYLWSNGPNTPFVIVEPLSTASYTVTTTNENGCSSVTTVTVVVEYCSSIGNFVWEDINRNGLQDDNEPGLADVVVTLSWVDVFNNTVLLHTQTDQNGMYLFDNLPVGEYHVTFTLPSDRYFFTTPNVSLDDAKDSDVDPITGRSQLVILPASFDNLTVDAGVYKCSRIGDYVWLDNGLVSNVQDDGDSGLNGITIQLFSETNPSVPLQTTISATNPSSGKDGFYQFDICTPGNYFLKVINGSTYNFVLPGFGDNATDSNISNAINGTSSTITVTYGVDNLTLDFGLNFPPLAVELINFEGERKNNNNVLYWNTANEVNNDYFLLFRSFNGSDFKEVGKVKAKDIPSNLNKYTWLDLDSELNGVYYYKLNQFDFDGRKAEYGPVQIKVGDNSDLKYNLFPNPSMQFANLVLESVNEDIQVEIVDIAGRSMIGVIHDVSNTNSTSKSYTLDASRLSSGIYLVKVTSPFFAKVIKWNVIKN